MAILVGDHQLNDFDAWFQLFKANPPPAIGRWRIVRAMDDPGHVQVVGEVEASEVAAVKEYLASERMQEAFAQVNALSARPLEFTWYEDVTSA